MKICIILFTHNTHIIRQNLIQKSGSTSWVQKLRKYKIFSLHISGRLSILSRVLLEVFSSAKLHVIFMLHAKYLYSIPCCMGAESINFVCIILQTWFVLSYVFSYLGVCTTTLLTLRLHLIFIIALKPNMAEPRLDMYIIFHTIFWAAFRRDRRKRQSDHWYLLWFFPGDVILI